MNATGNCYSLWSASFGVSSFFFFFRFSAVRIKTHNHKMYVNIPLFPLAQKWNARSRMNCSRWWTLNTMFESFVFVLCFVVPFVVCSRQCFSWSADAGGMRRLKKKKELRRACRINEIVSFLLFSTYSGRSEPTKIDRLIVDFCNNRWMNETKRTKSVKRETCFIFLLSS